MKRLRLLLGFGLILAVLGLLIVTPPAAASLQGTTGWLVTCSHDHSLPDDPIVKPFQPGASHIHDFVGNKTTTANSTYQTMTAGATTCLDSADTAGYWAPALYKNGVKVNPAVGTNSPRNQIYYRADNLAAGTKITPFPPDFRMTVGKSTATSVTDNYRLGREVYYGCSDNSPDVKATAPINCSTGIISVHFGFPNCWDGVHLDSADHQSHMTWPSYPEGKCPSTHPVAMPRVIMRFEYPVGTSSSGITLASGASYTEHGDFWNTWKQSRLDALVANCFNQFRDCGTPNNNSVGGTPAPSPRPTVSTSPTPIVTPTPSPSPSKSCP